MLKIMIIGLGKAGERFYRALKYIEKSEKIIIIDSVCDTNAETLIKIDDNICKFYNYEEALNKRKVDLIALCVNEYAHFQILKHIKEIKYEFIRILSEKPLVEKYDQYIEISNLYANNEITVNYVERYSPIISDFFLWQENKNFNYNKIEFFWGKFRINDKRYTIGDISEITHPIDLVFYLLRDTKCLEYKFNSCLCSNSNYSPYNKSLIDSIDIQFFVNNTFVLGHSSFVWEERKRRLILFCHENLGKKNYLISFDFDNPIWDTDCLRIFDITTTEKKLIFEKKYKTNDFPTEIYKISKIYKFIKLNLDSIMFKQHNNDLVWVNDCIFVQKLIEEISILNQNQNIFYNIV